MAASPQPSTSRLIGVFAKYWEAGRVKTRLAATIGDERAATIAEAFLRCLVARLNAVEGFKQIGYTPAERAADFADLAPGWSLSPQCEGDLGARMADFFQSAFTAGHPHAVLLGADCPNVPQTRIEDASRILQSHDVVCGPATDGGYYLIAARPPLSKLTPLLRHRRWGDSEVLKRTLALADQHQIRLGLTEPWNDVDQADDLATLRNELEASQCPHLVELREQLDSILGEHD